MTDALVCITEAGETYCTCVDRSWWDEMPRRKPDRDFWLGFAISCTRADLARQVREGKAAQA